MNIIELKTIDSTNRYLKNLIHTDTQLPNFLTVFTPQQTAGVGQYGAKWQTEPYMNLTFSTLFIPNNLSIENAFLLNMIVPITILKTLKEMNITEEINIKWPNDVIMAHKKIGGILIENILKGHQIIKSVIGIGLNVNQTNFENLPKASSLKKIIGNNFDIKLLMKCIVTNLEDTLSTLSTASFEDIYNEYKNYLFRNEKVSTFSLPDGTHFMGIIKGPTHTGELIVATEKSTQTFSLKQIELLY